MGRPRLYATSVERKAAWRRRQGMAVRPHYPSAGHRQASRLSGAQATGRPGPGRAGVGGDPAGPPDASAGGSLCWELHELTDAYSRDPDGPHLEAAVWPPLRATRGRPRPLPGWRPPPAVRRHRRALQRLAHVRATRGGIRGRAERHERRQHTGCAPRTRTRIVWGACEGVSGVNDRPMSGAPWHKRRVACQACARRIVSRHTITDERSVGSSVAGQE